MALAMKEACEKCAAALPPSSPDARICSYECTFCADAGPLSELRRRARAAAAPRCGIAMNGKRS
jgi:hypothetical protein